MQRRGSGCCLSLAASSAHVQQQSVGLRPAAVANSLE
jgi:hypothetical protein